MIKCCKCKRHKNVLEFHKNSKRKNGYNNLCKPCRREYQKQWYARNKKSHKENARQRKKQMRAQWKSIRNDLALICEKCGENHPACLEFHHVHPKKREMSIMAAFMGGKDCFKRELKKCVILCANCHKKIHYEMNGPLT